MDTSDAKTRESQHEVQDLPAQDVGAAEAAEVRGGLSVSGMGGTDRILGTTYGGDGEQRVYAGGVGQVGRPLVVTTSDIDAT